MNLHIDNDTCHEIIFTLGGVSHSIDKLYYGEFLVWEKQTQHDYSQDYFTVESLEDGNVITMTIPSAITTSDMTDISYSIDNGTTWTTTTIDGTAKTITVNLDNGGTVMWKGNGATTSNNTGQTNSIIIKGTKTHDMYGNIASLLYGDNFSDKTVFPSSGFGFCCLFYEDRFVVDASNLVLPFTSLRSYCYGLMFRGCSRLEKAPELPAITLANRCYWQMFSQCIALVEPPELKSTSLQQLCYGSMFNACTSLTKAPALPALTLASQCYQYMFNECTSLTEAPELPAFRLTTQCYQNMFSGCTSLNYIKCLATNISASNCTQNWVSNVAATGTFVKAATMSSWTINSVNGIPVGWTIHNYENCTVTLSVNDSSYGTVDGAGTYHTGDLVTIKANAAGGYRFVGWYDGSTLVSQNTAYTFKILTNVSYQAVFEVDYSNQYFTIESLEDENDITLDLTYTAGYMPDNTGPRYEDLNYVAYSVDNGSTWVTTTMDGTRKTISVRLDSGDKILLKGEGHTYVTNYYNTSQGTWIRHANSFASTGNFKCYGNIMSLVWGDSFVGKTSFRESSSETENTNSYVFSNLFKESNVTDVQNLIMPATTLLSYCYESMFWGCTSLANAPVLPATTLATQCYGTMFNGCTSLTEAPELPATTLANSCYYFMFENCTALTKAPELPAATLAASCYFSMFDGCTSLTEAPELPATTLAASCYNQMFYGCTSLSTPPELPAMTLAEECYRSMFGECTSLAKSPVLPATTLVTRCYQSMFYGCTTLNEVTCLATDISAAYCVTAWLSGVSPTGTFYKDSTMTSWPSGASGIPTNWTTINYN